MTDLVVIGAGFSGLFAGALAARRGLKVKLVARGQGGLQTGAGCIDIHGADANGAPLPAPQLSNLPSDHPYSQFDAANLTAAMAELQKICSEQGYPMVGTENANHWLPTALGAVRATALAPKSMLAGDLNQTGAMALVRLPHFRDFYPNLLADNLQAQPLAFERPPVVLDLPLPNAPIRREAYASDLARALDNTEIRREWLKAWRNAYHEFFEQPGQGRVTRIGFPAILGYRHTAEILEELQSAFDCPVFEIPILPPSVPGQRLYNALYAAFRAAGGQMVLGPTVHGQIDRHGTASATTTATGPARPLAADRYLLATGGMANGGLAATYDGKIQEATFDLPVAYLPQRADWVAPAYLAPQPYARFGVQVNPHGQPLNPEGQPLSHNLWACGSLLAGADRLTEASREGIALVSAYSAVQTMK